MALRNAAAAGGTTRRNCASVMTSEAHIAAALYSLYPLNMLSIESSLLLMTVLFNAGLAVFILRGNWRRPVNALFGAFLIALALWGLALVAYGASTTSASAIVFGKMAYAVALLVGGTFYLFSLAFPENRWPATGSTLTVVILAAAYCAALPLPSLLFAGLTVLPQGNQVVLYPAGYLCFALMFCFLFLTGLARTWRKWRTSSEPSRTQLLVIALSVTIAGLGGMFFNLAIASPFVDDFNYLWTGPLFTTVIAVAIMYAVFRFRLFSAKVIGTELLIALLWIFTLLRTLLAADPREQVLNGALFVLSVIIGALLVKSARDEVRAREALSEFMSFASHELRNPITAIRGFASNVLEGASGEVSPTVRDAVLKIRAESDTVLALISQYLSKSKLELGQLTYDVRSIDVGALVNGIAEGLQGRAREKGLTLRVHLAPAPALAQADEAKLREVIGNLIDNAIKYTKEGGVDVSLEERSGSARITVSDTGVGIPPETLHHLFGKFSRADAQRMNLLGSGLGLYLAKTFVEGMGGRIWAESDGLGRGSRFVVELGQA
jgi:signal transduction histidine kinase